MVLGILIAELIVLVAGIGWWQLGLTLAASLLVARFLSAQPASRSRRRSRRRSSW
jgi:uncharacterized membrane protein YgaE (UPF0421/DUF939 family)